MIPRRLRAKVLNLLAEFPAVAILGARQVGKTTLARSVMTERDALYLDLESASDAAKLAEPEPYLSLHANRLVIIDEVQRHPNLFQNLRGLIDRGRSEGKRAGRYLLLGSASLDLLQQSGESLAGRIAYLELNPLDVLEMANVSDDIASEGRIDEKLWVRGGFPDSFLATSEQRSMRWRENLIRTYLERDVAQLGGRISATTLRRLWTMLAHGQGTLLNASALAGALGVGGKTVANYTDLLCDLLLVRRLEPWHRNTKKRLVKSPKVYIRDSGLVHTLLNLQNREDILGHPVAGQSWEGFVIENLLAVVPTSCTANFYRTSAGAEIDLVLSFSAHERWAIEIKRSSAPKPSRGFYHACEDLKPSAQFVVYVGQERFPLSDQIVAINPTMLADEISATFKAQ